MSKTPSSQHTMFRIGNGVGGGVYYQALGFLFVGVSVDGGCHHEFSPRQRRFAGYFSRLRLRR